MIKSVFFDLLYLTGILILSGVLIVFIMAVFKIAVGIYQTNLRESDKNDGEK